MAKNSTSSPPRNYVLRVELLDFQPVIWRRFCVPASITLPKLHLVLQEGMGWTNSHLHSFHCGAFTYQPEDPDERFGVQDKDKDERRVKLCDLVTRVKQAIVYEYDFGDSWEHQITLEKIVEPDPAVTCLAGENACPPEDCGGSYGYERLIEILKDPSHEEHEDMLEWVGSSFNPKHFDLTEVSSALNKMKIKVPAKKSTPELSTP